MLRRALRDERGITSIDYAGILVVVAVIFGAFFLLNLDEKVGPTAEKAVCQILGGKSCGQEVAGAAREVPGRPVHDLGQRQRLRRLRPDRQGLDPDPRGLLRRLVQVHDRRQHRGRGGAVRGREGQGGQARGGPVRGGAGGRGPRGRPRVRVRQPQGRRRLPGDRAGRRRLRRHPARPRLLQRRDPVHRRARTRSAASTTGRSTSSASTTTRTSRSRPRPTSRARRS